MLFVPRFCSSAGRFSTSRAAADGLVDPPTVQVEQQIPPTDRQMDYALEFEVMIPDGVCKDDVSAIISRIADEDEETPDPGLSRYAHACGVKFSRFVGAKALLGFMVGQLQGAARAELYAYAVNRQEKGGSFSDPRWLPVYDALRACGAAVADLQAIVGAAGCLTAGAAAGVGGSESRRLASARMISTVPSDD